MSPAFFAAWSMLLGAQRVNKDDAQRLSDAHS